jgi:hypothetical protein
MKEELRNEMMRSDEDTAEMLKDMDRDDLLAYYRNFYQMVMDDPQMAAALPPEQLKTVKDAIDNLEKAYDNETLTKRRLAIAEQEVANARGQFNRVADKWLDTPSGGRDN